MTYDDLLREADNKCLVVKEKHLRSCKGRIRGNLVAIKKGIPTIEKACVLAEEIAHAELTVGNILDLSNINNRKQEYKARMKAYDKMIGIISLIKAYEAGCKSISMVADHLNVTEEFLLDAIKAYKAKYGLFTKQDNYLIYFEPSLSVLKLICKE